MDQLSALRVVRCIGGLSLASLTFAGCIKDVGLGPGGGYSAGAGGASYGVAGSTGVGGGFFGSSASFAASTGGFGGFSIGTGGSAGTGGSIGVGTGGFGTTGVGGSVTASVGSAVSTTATTTTGVGSSGGPPLGCQLGSEPVACNFSHLNADCASFGAVCDFIFSQCSCCFLHDTLSCTTDADCEASFGASSFCSAGTCGCK